jgi:hypothetical protein
MMGNGFMKTLNKLADGDLVRKTETMGNKPIA